MWLFIRLNESFRPFLLRLRQVCCWSCFPEGGRAEVHDGPESSQPSLLHHLQGGGPTTSQEPTTDPQSPPPSLLSPPPDQGPVVWYDVLLEVSETVIPEVTCSSSCSSLGGTVLEVDREVLRSGTMASARQAHVQVEEVLENPSQLPGTSRNSWFFQPQLSNPSPEFLLVSFPAARHRGVRSPSAGSTRMFGFWRCWRLYGISTGVIYCRGAGVCDGGGADSESGVGEQRPQAADSLFLFLRRVQPKAANLHSNPNIGAGRAVYCFPAILQIWVRALA